jgi:hypothetical protein
LTTQSVRDHLKFTIEEALGNMYRMVFFENNRPCLRHGDLIKFIMAAEPQAEQPGERMGATWQAEGSSRTF